jgi:hypothetical protein
MDVLDYGSPRALGSACLEMESSRGFHWLFGITALRGPLIQTQDQGTPTVFHPIFRAVNGVTVRQYN